MNARVAVITPTYNRGHNGLLKKTLLSVHMQTRRDFLHLVVDDGSTDNTPELVGRYMQFDPRVIYMRRNRVDGQKFGASAASNHGINLVLRDPLFSDVAFVTFLHSDDMLHSCSLEKRAGLMDDNPRLRLVYSSLGICDDAMNLNYVMNGPSIRHPKKLASRLKRHVDPFPNHTLMLRRDLLAEVDGYDENLGSGEDRDFSIRALDLLSPEELAIVAETLVYYRVHNDSVTALYSEMSWHKADRAYFVAKYGRTAIHRVGDLAYRFITRPHSFLPEPIKVLLRPVRASVLQATSNPGSVDELVRDIELRFC